LDQIKQILLFIDLTCIDENYHLTILEIRPPVLSLLLNMYMSAQGNYIITHDETTI